MNFGTEMKRHRLRLDLSYKQLAEKLGMSATHLSRVEKEQTPPSPKLIYELRELFGLDKNSFFHISGMLARTGVSIDMLLTVMKESGFRSKVKKLIKDNYYLIKPRKETIASVWVIGKWDGSAFVANGRKYARKDLHEYVNLPKEEVPFPEM